MTTMFTKKLEYAATRLKQWANDPECHPEMTAAMLDLQQTMNEISDLRDQDRIDEYFAAKSV